MSGNRCRNCRLWRKFQGNEPTVPLRNSRACLLRLRYVRLPTKERVLVPSLDPRDAKGPHWGKRTPPDFTCEYFAAKHKTYVKPEVPE